MAAVTSDGLTLEEVSRKCLGNLVSTWDELWDEPPPTETDLEEMRAEEESWGDDWRTLYAEQLFQQAETAAREEQKSLKRKREEEDLAKWQAETADGEKEENIQQRHACERRAGAKQARGLGQRLLGFS